MLVGPYLKHSQKIELPFEKDEFTPGQGRKGYRSDMGKEELVTGDRMSRLGCLLCGTSLCSVGILLDKLVSILPVYSLSRVHISQNHICI